MEISKIVLMLVLAYPRQAVSKQTIGLYEKFLADIDQDMLEQAAKSHIATSQWFPTIAELRSAVTQIVSAAAKLPSAAEAWGEVVEQMKLTGSYKRPTFSSPVIARLVDSFGWQELCMSENAISDRARFIDAYDVMVKREQHTMTLLPETREHIDRLSAGTDAIKRLTDKLGGK
jgi:hypothetical protein